MKVACVNSKLGYKYSGKNDKHFKPVSPTLCFSDMTSLFKKKKKKVYDKDVIPLNFLTPLANAES